MGQKGENYDIWLEGYERPSYPKLATDLEVDVLVIGGGITGVSTTYELAKAGVSVALVERGRLGEWTTDCTTGFLTQSVDTSYRDLIFILGEEKARLVAESKRFAIDHLAQIISDEGIACDFESVSNYLLARTKAESKYLKREGESLDRVGILAEYQLGSKSSLGASGYLEITNQATYQPMKYLTVLAERATTYGAKIFEQTEALAIERRGDIWQVKVGDQQIRAKDVVVATYSPWREPKHLYFRKALYRSYVLELETSSGVYPDGLYEDLAHPYHYFRILNRENKCQIIFGGEDHREDLPIRRAKNYQALESAAKKFFSSADFKIIRRWSGQILESIDGLPYIGQDKSSGLYYAFGFSGNGLTYSALAGALLAELITGRVGLASRYKNLYRVNRWPSLKALLVKGRDYGLIFLGGFAKNIFIKNY